MGLDFNETDYIHGVWMCPVPQGEFLFVLYQAGGRDGVYKIIGRQRVAVDDRVWDSNDHKRWVHFETGLHSLEENLGKAHYMASRYCIDFADGHEPLKPDYVPVNGDRDEMLRQMQTREWCHVKKIPNGDVEAFEQERERSRKAGLGN